ncbi:MAG: hypothetical protein HYR76_03835 [Ignavibacteria bacterium]|nr:hypothetical protein [Ignavibacteria bacterium]MBI3765142.1 hypothetical protein [Ignavibacteriales bacterium]
MRQGKRVKPKFPIEYRVLITPRFKEQEKEIVTHVAIRTVSEFTSFRYQIVVETNVSDRTIRLSIQGLRAPQVTLPATGPAVFETEFKNLSGTYTVIISKLDRDMNEFSISISDRSVTVKKSPKKKFAEIVTNEEDW